MNCPSCGLPTRSDQKFCRSCGAGLQMTTQPLGEHVAVFDRKRTPADVSNSVANKLGDETRRSDRRALWALIMMFIGIAFGAIGKMLIHQDIVTVVGVLLSVAGMFMLAYSSLSPPRPKKYNSIPSARPEVLTQTQPPKSLSQGSNTDYVPSITERTTDLLKTPATATESHKHDDGKLEA